MKIPYGISDFYRLMDENYYFLDRTNYIGLLEEQGAPYLFFLRPRRFGKSLWISILKYYYGIEYQESFQKLFGRTSIGQNPTSSANSFHILYFEFSRIDTNTWESTFEGFRQNVLSGLKNFEDRYGSSEQDYEHYEAPSNILKVFFDHHKDKKIYLLIDEYDHFANEVLGFRFDDFMKMVTGMGFVRKFYETIKGATGVGIVDRFFATGVTPITIDSMTSGFNITTNLSRSRTFHDMLGFRENEVHDLLCDALPESFNVEDLSQRLREWYNGYAFVEHPENRLYNTDMVLYFVSHVLRENELPQDLLDENIASDYGKIKRLFDIKNKEQNYNILEQLVLHGTVITEITKQFSFEKNFEKKDFLSLLFYMGMLSIQDGLLGQVRLRIPNFAIQGLYFQLLLSVLNQKYSLDFETLDIREALVDLAQNNSPKPLIGFIEKTLEVLSNRDFQGFDEKYIKLLLITFVSQSTLYFIKSEPEIQQHYPDVMLLYRPPFFPNYQFVFELKYLKKNQARQSTKVRKEAIQQLQGYLQTKELKALKNLKAYVVVFVGEKAKVIEELQT